MLCGSVLPLGPDEDELRYRRRMAASSGDSGGRKAVKPKPKPLTCIECGENASTRATGFRAYLADDGEIVFYCRSCAEREFDDFRPIH